MRHSPVVVLLLSFCMLVQGQQKIYLFRNLNKDHGLSNNSVRTICRDRQGFLWIGTNEGLNRYDGYTFKCYKRTVNDTTSLRDNLITSILEDLSGKLWVTAGDYLEVFDPATERFGHRNALFNNKLKVPLVSKSSLAIDSNGYEWFGNSSLGLHCYIPSKDSLMKIKCNPLDDSCLSSDSIMSVAVNSHNDIWVTTKKSTLEKVDAKTGKVTQRVKLSVTNDNYYKCIVDRDDDIWLYDFNNSLGLFFYSPTNRQLVHYTHESSPIRLSSNVVFSIINDNQGRIWVGTDHGGITVIDKQHQTVEYILNDPYNQRSLCGNSITHLYGDKDGFIWIGTFKHGLSQFHDSQFSFNLNHVKMADMAIPQLNDIDNFAEDAAGNLWIGTNGGGVVFFDRAKNSYTNYQHQPNDPQSLSANVIIGMLIDSQQRLWVGTYFGGLNLWTGKGFYRFKHQPGNPSSITDDRVWDVCEDKQGKIWIATLLGGVNLINPETKKVDKVIAGFQSPMKSAVVFDINCDRSGKLWFSTVDGLRCYDESNNEWQYFYHEEGNPHSLNKNLVYSTMEDSRGWIWIATGDGVNYYNPNTKQFSGFKTDDGLPSNNVLTILEDDQHRIWLGTSNGLCCIKVQEVNHDYNFSFKNYDDRDGLQGKEFNEKSAFKTSKGELLFGGHSGFNMFNPENIKLQNLQSATILTDFQVFNKSIAWDNDQAEGYKLEKPITVADKIVLDYASSVFSIEFSNLNFFFPERRQFQFVLDGFHTEWITVDAANRKATYTNLDPGTYLFRVRATNNDGSWSQNERQLKIIVLPPWWRTLTFKLGMVVLLIFLAMLLYGYKISSYKHQQMALKLMVNARTKELQELNCVMEERQEEISAQNEELAMHRSKLEMLVEKRTAELEIARIKAEESDRLKSAFLANMSHEIRTPMNAIIGFSTLLRDDSLQDHERNEFIDVIQNNCESLLVIINDILDISKIEANQIDIVKTHFDLTAMMLELEGTYKLMQPNNVAIMYDQSSQNEEYMIYADLFRLKQIMQNLISNALKFTLQGEVRFGYEKHDDHVLLYVKDTGIGIDEKDFNRIFEQFNKINDIQQGRFFKGTGLGLAISKKLVNLLGGQIWLESHKGIGTGFYFTIATNK